LLLYKDNSSGPIQQKKEGGKGGRKTQEYRAFLHASQGADE
jgi:hypothetical protein